VSERAISRASGDSAMLADFARFRADDPDALVAASLACPFCLRCHTTVWTGALSGHDPLVECRCIACDERWRVYLMPQQALRLSMLDH
jgi:hypothetical protein